MIMYSIGNEIPEAGNKFDVQWGKKLTDKLRSLDDTRYTTNSLNLLLAVMNDLPKLMAQNTVAQVAPNAETDQPQEINSMMNNLGGMMAQLLSCDFAAEKVKEACAQVDITGYNYAADRYEIDGKLFPNRILVGSETNPPDLDKNWELVEKLPYVIGDFDWTAWDYIGETGIGKINYTDQQGMGFYAPYPLQNCLLWGYQHSRNPQTCFLLERTYLGIKKSAIHCRTAPAALWRIAEHDSVEHDRCSPQLELERL